MKIIVKQIKYLINKIYDNYKAIILLVLYENTIRNIPFSQRQFATSPTKTVRGMEFVANRLEKKGFFFEKSSIYPLATHLQELIEINHIRLTWHDIEITEIGFQAISKIIDKVFFNEKILKAHPVKAYLAS